jgi:SAM-dependent methyltransferase
MEFPARDNAWWRARSEILNGWLAIGWADESPGFVLKTDLFDEACGPYHHGHLLDARHRFIGIDIDLNVVRRAGERLDQEGDPSPGIVADVRSLPFRSSCLQAVISLSTLDHFDHAQDIAFALEEIYRVLLPGGGLWLTLDNPVNPEVALRAHLPAWMVSIFRSDRFSIGKTLNADEAEAVIRRTGFEIHQRQYLIHAFRYLNIRIARVLRRLGLRSAELALVSRIRSAERRGNTSLSPLTGHYVCWILRRY